VIAAVVRVHDVGVVTEPSLAAVLGDTGYLVAAAVAAHPVVVLPSVAVSPIQYPPPPSTPSDFATSPSA